MTSSLKPGDRVRVKFPGYWAHGKVGEVVEGSRQYGIPLRFPAHSPDVFVLGPENLVPAGG